MKPAPGRYRINVVAELAGVPAATLRAWERRYGIPTPARTASAYRLYSDDDVAEVKRLRDLCASGMAISEAARLVQADRATDDDLPAGPTVPLPTAAAMALDGIVAAVRDFDPDGIQREVGRALYVGNAEQVFEQVFGPALRRVGDLWHDGQISIGQEHLASRIIQDATASLVRLTQPAAPQWRAVLACFEDEDHVIGLYGVAIQLASWGIQSTILGARTPPEAIADAIAHLDPDAVGLSVTVVRDGGRRDAAVDAYAAACAGRPWFVGGPGVAPLAELIRARGGLALVGSLSDHRVAIERAFARRADARA